jgi:hypothetical protein
MNRARVRLFAFVIAAALSAPFVPFEASAEKRECSQWFPDFSHCDRSGRYEGFTMPISMPYLFEDPFITTGVQAVGIWHDFTGATLGGEAWVLAVQARLAITDKLAFVASKDGYSWFRDTNPGVGHPEGFWDLAFGLKYALIENREDKYIVSGVLRFDVPSGQSQVLSGNGSGVIIPSLSGAWGIDKLHFIGDLGFRIPFSPNAESTSMFYNLAVSYNLLEHLIPIIEMGGYHWIKSGRGTSFATAGFEGVDVVNLGSSAVSGNDIVTLSFGFRVPIRKHVTAGVAYEIPATKRRDIFARRATMNLLWEF